MAKKKKTTRKAKKAVTKAKKESAKKVKKFAKKAKRVMRKAKKVVKKTVPKKAGGKAKLIGTVTHWFGNISVAIIKLKAPVSKGDRIRIVHGEHEAIETISSMQTNHEPIEKAKAGKEIGVKIKEKAHEGDSVFRA